MMTELNLQEYPDDDRRVGERRFFHIPPSPGGRGSAYEGWARVLLPIIVGAIVAYFTAIGTIRTEVGIVKSTEQNHFEEVLRRLALIQAWQDRQDSKR